ncbi:MAG: cytochrome c maturation protein CcmE [Deltaproteobacteria bacterium]|nr:cytochrome c maturation protein CcmE [Deltaproteobacteria bacterium]
MSAPPVVTVRARKKNLARWVVLGALAVVIALVASTMRGSAFVYSKYVDEVVQNPSERARWTGRMLRVEGLVAAGSIEHRPGTRAFRFRVERNHASLAVYYQGIVPDTFRDCAGVTVRGVLQPDGTFNAEEIVAKCPSKYEAATVVNGECVVGPAQTPGPSTAR